MPTGYTSYIYDGKITNGSDFLKLCTRAFGIAVDIKDENLSVATPNHFEPDPFYEEMYKKAISKRNKYKRMTADEARQEFVEKEIKSLNSSKECLNKMIEENNRCLNCAEEVKEWAEQEYIEKPVISKSDRAFLEYIKEEFKCIARDKNSNLFMYTSMLGMDKKETGWWGSDYYCLNSKFDIDFPMVKWSDKKPWLIKDLKKLEVVEEYEK